MDSTGPASHYFFEYKLVYFHFELNVMSTIITIETASFALSDCESIIIVPERAVQEAGYIKTFTIKDSAHAKHEYHAMAQMAYFQFQDDELDVVGVDSMVTVTSGKERFDVVDGLIMYRVTDGSFHVVVHKMQNKKKLLEAAYRYCTRWVRLDI